MKSLNDMTIGEFKELTAMIAGNKALSRVEGDLRPVIVRARDAGVHYGKLVSYSGREVVLQDARRLWSWTAKSGVALNGVATNGIVASTSKIDSLVPRIVILDACEIIDCSIESALTIESA